MEKLYKASHTTANGLEKLSDFSNEIRPEVRVITEEKNFDELEESWADLVDLSETTIFQTFEWNRTWWKHYGENGQLHLLTVYQEEKLVGIAPLFKDSINFLGLQEYLCLRFLGSDVSQPAGGDLLGLIPYTDYLDFIIRPGYEDVVYMALLHYFCTCNIDYDEILLDVVPQHSSAWKYLIPMLKKNGMRFSVEECLSSQQIILQDGWQDYLMTVSKNSRSHIRRALKKIENPAQKIFDEFEVVKEEHVLPFFERLVELHQSRWNRLGSLGTFAEKKNYEFHKEVSQIFFKRGWLQIKVLQPVENAEKSVAIDINYRFKNQLYGVHSSLDVDSKYYSEGPGSILLNATLKGVAKSHSLMRYDFMRGAEDYKIKLSNQASRNRQILLINTHSSRSAITTLLKEYAVFRRYLYREWRQFMLFFKIKSSFWDASAEYAQFQLDRVRTKFR